MESKCQTHPRNTANLICQNQQCNQNRIMCYDCIPNHKTCDQKKVCSFAKIEESIQSFLVSITKQTECLQAFCLIQQRMVIEQIIDQIKEQLNRFFYLEYIISQSRDLSQIQKKISLQDYLENKAIREPLQSYFLYCQQELSTLNKLKNEFFFTKDWKEVQVSDRPNDSPYKVPIQEIFGLLEQLMTELNLNLIQQNSHFQSFLQPQDSVLIPICEILIKEKLKYNFTNLDQQIGILCNQILNSKTNKISARAYSIMGFCSSFNDKQKLEILQTINDMDLHQQDYLSSLSAGMYCMEQQDYKNAQKNFKQAILLKEKYSVLHFLYGNSFFADGDNNKEKYKEKYKEAVKQYQYATEIDCDFTLAYIKLAQSFEKLEEYQNAIDACDQALIQDENNQEAQDTKEVCKIKLRQKNKK